MTCPQCHTENTSDSQFCKKCAAHLPSSGAGDAQVSFTRTMETPREELNTGTTLAGRYLIIEELGKGGMGRVYRAKDTRLDEEVAIKFIRPEIASDKKILERFSNELKLARKVSHKNVGRMYEFMEYEGTAFITMEYVRGENLNELARKIGKFNVGHAISIARQMCQGLAEAHRLNIVHRDLKPTNIMVDADGNLRIMDFGLARVEKSSKITSQDKVIGTPAYMAPEQMEGKEIDQRTDIYSLGVIIYELLTGRLPFDAETPVGIALKQKLEDPDDPRALNPHIPADLSRLILKCLEKTKTSRYQDVREIITDLERIEQGLPTSEKELPKRKSSPSKEITVTFNRRKVVILSLALIAIAVGTVIVLRSFRKVSVILPPKIENSVAIIGFENQTGSSSYDYLQKAIPNLMITNLENSGGNLYVATWERMFDLLRQMGKEDADLTNRELGFEVCRREGIERIVFGSFIKAGDVFATDVKVLDVETRKLIESSSSQGEGIDSILRTQIDELSQDISRSLITSGGKADPAEMRIEDVTTSSLEAYNYYLKGREAIDKLYWKEASINLKRALEIDPDFAEAYLYLSRVYHYLFDFPARNRSYQQAMSLAKKVSEKERFYIEALHAWRVEGDVEKSLRIYQELIAKYPREKRAYYQLALLYRSVGQLDTALAQLQKTLELDPFNGPALNLIAYIYLDLHESEKALEYFQKYADAFPNDANPRDSLGEVYFQMGDLNKALAEYEKALEIKSDFGSEWSIAYVHAFKEEYFEAVRWYRQYIDKATSPGRKVGGYYFIGLLHDFMGNSDSALNGFEQGRLLAGTVGNYDQEMLASYLSAWVYFFQADYERSLELVNLWFSQVSSGNIPINRELFLLLHVLLDIRLGRTEQTKARLNEMESLIAKLDSPSQGLFAYLHKLLWAEIHINEGNPQEAINLLDQYPLPKIPSFSSLTLMFYNLPFTKDTLARAHQAAGDLDEAIAAYEKLITFDPARNDRFFVHPLYHYRLAKLYEEKGSPSQALKQYEKFLWLWQYADPHRAKVKDAKGRVAVLKN